MHRLFSWTADAVGCWARLVVGVCSPFQKIDHDKSMVDYSAKCAPAFAPAHTIPIDIHHRHALTCDLRIPNPAWFRDSTDLFFHFFLSQPDRKACFYPPPPGLFFYGAPRSCTESTGTASTPEGHTCHFGGRLGNASSPPQGVLGSVKTTDSIA